MNTVQEILTKTGALLNGHFVGVSGKHLDTYITKDALLPHTDEVSLIASLLAEQGRGLEVDMVVGPALGGAIFSQWTAHHLSKSEGREILSLYTEKTANLDQVLTRGYDELVNGKKVLVVEDTVTTGGSAMKVVRAAQAAGGEVVKLLVVVNRDPDNINSDKLGIPFASLCNIPLISYEPDECPMCKSLIPLNTRFGHGKSYKS